MTDTLIDLSGKIDGGRERTIRDVAGACDALAVPFFLVGAFARDLLLELSHGLKAQRATDALHGDRLESLLEYLVDTPVRGFVYERSARHPGGEEIVTRARERFRIPCAVVSPGDDVAAAVARVLGG